MHRPVHTGTDIYGEDGCQPVPARFLIFGDSIAACSLVDQAHCAPYLVAQYIQTHYAPALTIEPHAVLGAHVADLVGQTATVAGGPGHLFVFVFAIANDLLTGNFDVPSLSADYDKFLDVFADTSRFPDGATFLLNTQYGPADQCAVPGAAGFYTPEGTQRIIQTNHDVILVPAESRANAVAVDQYPDFLGHGDNANLHGCPYCGPDNSTWLIAEHPNAAGNAHIAAKWYPAMDAMLSPACHGG